MSHFSTLVLGEENASSQAFIALANLNVFSPSQDIPFYGEKAPLHPLKHAQFLASRHMMRDICEKYLRLGYQGIAKDAQGAPFLKNHSAYFLSIAHDDCFVAVMLAPFAIGIDIEKTGAISAWKTQHRFLCEKEKAHCQTPLHALSYWVIKEAAYKCLKGRTKDFKSLCAEQKEALSYRIASTAGPLYVFLHKQQDYLLACATHKPSLRMPKDLPAL